MQRHIARRSSRRRASLETGRPVVRLMTVLGAAMVLALALPGAAFAQRSQHGSGHHGSGHQRGWQGGGGQWQGGGHRHGGFHGWYGGRWHRGWHNGAYSWWWIAPGLGWYSFGAPVYPYPNPYVPPEAAAPAPAGGYWYYCASPAGYYPYVPQCSVPWQPVVPQPQG